jgi:HupE / UreJ protein
VAAGFGLVHGMAFSDTLRQLSLEKTQMLWSLLGFNLGIEAVQLAIVAVAAPLLFWLCQTKAYLPFRFMAGALGIGAALYWIWERV